MLIPTLINPVDDVREQVVNSNSMTGGLPRIVVADYLTEDDFQCFVDMVQADGSKALEGAIGIVTVALQAEYDLAEDVARAFSETTLRSTEFEETLSRLLSSEDGLVKIVEDVLASAYDHVRLTAFAESMRVYQDIHKIYFANDRAFLFDPSFLLSRMRTQKTMSREEADTLIAADKQSAFSTLYAMSVLEVDRVVPIPEMKVLMTAARYQSWKGIILSDTSASQNEKTKQQLKDVSVD